MPSENPGVLFGGTLQSTGTFDFQSPAGTISLPPLTRGKSAVKHDVLNGSLDGMEGRFAGDDRGGKRQFGTSSGQANSPFKMNFGQNAPANIFDSTNAQQTQGAVTESAAAQQANSPFKINFGQNTPANIFGSTNAQQTSGGNPFSFTPQPQPPVTSGFNFNSQPATPSNPASTPFSFGGNPSLPAAPTPAINLGSGPAHDQPGNNLSSQQMLAQLPVQLGLGSLAPQQTASTAFTFGQTSGVSSSGINFGSTPTTTAPKNNIFDQKQPATAPNFFGSSQTQKDTPQNLFGTSQSQVAAPSNMFGSVTPQTTTSGIFANLNATAPAPAPAPSNMFGSSTSTGVVAGLNATSSTRSNMFGSTDPQTTSSGIFANLQGTGSSASNLFGNREQNSAPSTNNSIGSPQTTNTTNLFGNPNQTSAMSDLFGEKKLQDSPSSNIFGDANKPTSNIFAPKQPTLAGDLFGATKPDANSTKDLFGNLNKPVDPSVSQPKVGANASTSADGSTSNTNPSVFNKAAPSSNFFGVSKALFSSTPPTPQPTSQPTSTPSFPSGSTQSSASQNGSSSIFSPIKPVDAPTASSQPSGISLGFPQTAKTLQKPNDQFNKPPNPSFSTLPDSIVSSSKPSGNSQLVADVQSFYEDLDAAAQVPEDHMAPLVPVDFDDDLRKQFYAAYRMRCLNKSMQHMFGAIPMSVDPTPILAHYNKQRFNIMSSVFPALKKRKMSYNEDQENENPGRRPKQGAPPAAAQSPVKGRMVDSEDQENENPVKQSRHVELQKHVQPMSNGEITSHGQTAAPLEASLNGIGPNSSIFNRDLAPPSAGVTASPSPSRKRAAEEYITSETEKKPSVRPLRQINTPRPSEAAEQNASGSNTSNIFRNILDSPAKSPTKVSPQKNLASLPEAAKGETPRLNPFSNLPGASSPSKSTFSALSAASSTNMLAPKAASTATNLFSSISGTLSPPKSAAAVPAVTPSTNLFSTQGAVATSSTNLFAPKPTSAVTNPFQLKPAAGTSNDSDANGSKGIVLKPPTFNVAPVDFMAQFGQKAAKDEEEAERKLMERDMEEDMDSDDDEEEWKANWKAKRLAAKKELEEAGKKGKKFTFDASKSSETASKTVATTQPAASKPLFGQNAASQSSANSALSSPSGSRTPTPGPFGSSTGSVLEGHAPGKPVSFAKNIFAHLSDAESGKADDADDESGDDDTEEADSENKDPTYMPGEESGSGPGTPGTPVEDTGAGIASTKKTSLFNFGSSNTGSVFGSSISGTSTPNKGLSDFFSRISKDNNGSPIREQPEKETTPKPPSLFDRIAKDGNGNPIREISSEEKENTQPSTGNIFRDKKNPFGNLNSTPGAPADQTWKPDSPIRFGTPDAKDSAPIVSVTSATPTKTGSPLNLFGTVTDSDPKPFSNLFGNGASKPAPAAAPFSNLFGSSGAAKGLSSGVGFNFGASSTTSSLFPSAAGSTNTSRATSPGATTDGGSGEDVDPDAEKHEQIDLTTLGAGTEDEEVIHDVRAKALKFVPNNERSPDNPWVNQGVGKLWVLKHKETNAVRVLLRTDPSGKIVLNKALLAQVNYEATGKTLKLLAAADSGKGLETYILQVKTPEFASDLAEVLQANKPAP